MKVIKSATYSSRSGAGALFSIVLEPSERKLLLLSRKELGLIASVLDVVHLRRLLLVAHTLHLQPQPLHLERSQSFSALFIP